MKVTDDLPRWVMWPLRIVFYGFVLYILFGIAQMVASARLQSNIEECLSSSRRPSDDPTQNRLARLRGCLDRKNGIFEKFANSPASKAIDALSNHPVEFVGHWDWNQPRCHYKYELTESGEYTAEPVKCSTNNKRYTGAWGILEDQIVWLSDSSSTSPIEFDPIEAPTKDAFVLVENDGSRTQFTRIIETPVTLAGNEPLAEEPVKQVPLPEGTTRLSFGGIAPHPGALAVSADGSTVAHITMNSDVEVWNPLDEKPLEVIPANGKQPGALAISSDGNVIAIGHFDSQVTVWSRLEHRVTHQFSGASGAISAMAFSRDAKWLAVGSDDTTTQLWEIASERLLKVFDSMANDDISQGAGIPVAIGFSGDGKALIVNEWYSRFYDVGRGISIWDIDDGIEISTRTVAPPNSDNTMRAGQALGGAGWLLAYTGDFASAGKAGLMVERLDSCAPAIQLPAGGYAETVVADPLGRWVASADDEKLTFFTVSNEQKAASVLLPGKAIALVPHPDGHSVIALMIDEVRFNGNEHFIFGRDAETVTRGALYRIQIPEPFWSLSPLVIGDGAALCPPATAVREVQNFKVPQAPTELKSIARLVPTKEMTTDPDDPTGEYNQINPPRELYFGKDQSLYALYHAYSDFRSGVAVWDLLTQQPTRTRFRRYVGDTTLRLKEGWGARSQESQTGHPQTETLKSLLTGNPFLVIKDVNTQKLSAPISDPDTGDVFWGEPEHFRRYTADGRQPDDVNTSGVAVAYAARNGRLAALYLNGSVQVWQFDAPGNSKTYDLRLDSESDESPMSAGALALSADGRYLRIVFANGSGDGPDVYSVYDLKSANRVGDGALLAPFPGHSNRGVVADVRRNHLAVWDFDKAAIIARLPRQPSHDENGAYQQAKAVMSDDGRLVASGSYDGLVRIWDIDSHQMVGEGHADGEIACLAFDPTGSKLAVGRADGEIAVFQVPTQKR